MNSEYIKSLNLIKKQMEAISAPLQQMQESLKVTANIIEDSKAKVEPILPNIEKALLTFAELLPKTINISSVMKDYFEKIQEPLKAIRNILSNLNIQSRINVADEELLKNFYWVIPFEYNYENLDKLKESKDINEYEKYMLDYFNAHRVKRLFEKTREQCKEEDKKELLNQIEDSYISENYAICITSLITLLDGLTLDLITQNSEKQHLSYKAITSMIEFMNEHDLNEFGYELYLKVCILNNFYNKLYENETILKNNKKNILSRHLNSHGVVYLNDKINVLRLLNGICFCQEIISETKMQESFFRTKQDRRFKMKGSGKSDRNTKGNIK